MKEGELTYRHYPGTSCACVAWSGIFRHLGYDLQESDIFGLGCGINFGYAAVGKTKYFDISLISLNIIEDLFTNLGVYGKLFQYSDNSKCLNVILDSINRGIPVAVQLNPCFCKGLISITPKDVQEYLPLHWVVVVGYDYSTRMLTIYDNRQFAPIEMSFDEFMEARNSTSGLFDQNPRNFLYHIYLPGKLNSLDIAMKSALTKTCVNFLDIDKTLSFFTGDYGYEKCIRQIAMWNQFFPKDELRMVLKRIQSSVTGAAGVKGGYRRLFSRFLMKGSELWGMEELVKLSTCFGESACLWDSFVNKLIQYEDCNLPWGEDCELSFILRQIHSKEMTAFNELRILLNHIN